MEDDKTLKKDEGLNEKVSEKLSEEETEQETEQETEGEIPLEEKKELYPPESFGRDDRSGDDFSEPVKRNKIVYVAVASFLVLALIAAAFSGVFGDFLNSKSIVEEPDILPENGNRQEQYHDDTPVATVNGEEITAGELAMSMRQERENYKAQGLDIDSPEMAEFLKQLEQQMVDRLITMKLLAQQAVKEGYEASDEEIDKRFMEYAEMVGGKEQFLAQIQLLDMSEQELNQEIALEIAIDYYLGAYIDDLKEAGRLDYTEEELKELYNEYEDQIEEDYEDIKERLADIVRSEKENELVLKLIEQLKEESEIVYLL